MTAVEQEEETKQAAIVINGVRVIDFYYLTSSDANKSSKTNLSMFDKVEHTISNLDLVFPIPCL